MDNLFEFHQSAINMFLKCGKQFEFRYLRGIKSPPKAALTLGGALDAAVTHNYIQKVETQNDLPVDDVLDAYSTDFDKRAEETEWGEDRPGDQKDLGARMLKLFQSEAAPKIQPATVQEGFRIETDRGYALGGTLDLTDVNGYVRDTKTSKASYQEDAVSDNIQAAMYDFAYETKNKKKATGFVFDVVTKTKIPKYQHVSGVVSANQRARLFETIDIMYKQIQRGEFNYAPEGAWWCSKSWCAYHHLCKGKK